MPPPTFTKKTWVNAPGTSTPLDATGMGDLEQRLSDFSVNRTKDVIVLSDGTADNNSLKIVPTVDKSPSQSVGGALYIDNTLSAGAGIVVYSNHAASQGGRLLVLNAANAGFDQSAMALIYAGTSHAMTINHSGSGSSAEALDVVSTNSADTTLGVGGNQTGRGVVKITHNYPGSSDANASAISLLLNGAGTACQGIYLNTGAGVTTTGDLIQFRQDGTAVFQVTSDGTVKIRSVPVTAGNINWVPVDHGFLSWSYDPSAAVNSYAGTAGLLHVVKLHAPYAISVTNIILTVVTAGATLTTGQCFASVYQSGSRLGITADQATNWQTTGNKIMPISGGPIAVAAGDFYVAYYSNGITQPAFGRGSGNAMVNAGIASASSRYGTADSGLTTTPPATMGTIGALNVAIWAAVS